MHDYMDHEWSPFQVLYNPNWYYWNILLHINFVICIMMTFFFLKEPFIISILLYHHELTKYLNFHIIFFFNSIDDQHYTTKLIQRQKKLILARKSLILKHSLHYDHLFNYVTHFLQLSNEPLNFNLGPNKLLT